MSKLVAFTPFLRRAQCDQRGAPLGKRRRPVPRGAALCRCPGGKPRCIFAGWWGHVVPNPQKIIVEVGLAPIRGRWWVWVHPCAENKKRRKRQNKVSNPLGPNFCKAHISKLVCTPPFFLLSLQSPHQLVPKNAIKNFRIFWTPPPEKKIFFPAMPSSKSPKLRSFLYSSHK